MADKEKLIELLGCKYNCVDRNRCLYEQADYLLKNGVIAPPCKVGDVLYEICERRRNNKWEKVIAKRVVHGIEIGLNGSLCAKCGTTIMVFFSGLGKTVFLTREESEKVLKECEG